MDYPSDFEKKLDDQSRAQLYKDLRSELIIQAEEEIARLNSGMDESFDEAEVLSKQPSGPTGIGVRTPEPQQRQRTCTPVSPGA